MYFASTGTCKYNEKCYKLHIRDPTKGRKGDGKANVAEPAAIKSKGNREELMKERDDLNQMLEAIARAESSDSIGPCIACNKEDQGSHKAFVAKMTPCKPSET